MTEPDGILAGMVQKDSRVEPFVTNGIAGYFIDRNPRFFNSSYIICVIHKTFIGLSHQITKSSGNSMLRQVIIISFHCVRFWWKSAKISSPYEKIRAWTSVTGKTDIYVCYTYIDGMTLFTMQHMGTVINAARGLRFWSGDRRSVSKTSSI